jgi:pimeloyl-ACP methyl ester carboxylesterase
MRTPAGTAYDLIGPSDAPAVVLIHGVGLNRAVWQWLLPQLGRYRVLTYDFFGHGETVPPPPNPTLTTLSEQLVEVMQHAGITRAAVIGFSLGGMIARRFAQDHPDRVTALGILHSPHRRSPAAQAAILTRVDRATSAGPAATVDAALERWFTDACRATNPALMALVRAWVLANDPALYPLIYRLLAHGVEEIIAPQPPIACPTLVMTGDEDFGNGPQMTHAIAAEIAGSETVILLGLRHMALAENPAAVNAPLLAFLDRHHG